MNKEQFKTWCENPNKPLIMGILNATPDSFSGDGLYQQEVKALNQVKAFLKAGADLIDIGGESSRPGAEPVSAQEEMQRVVPLIKKIRQFSDVCISIDTVKPDVMSAAVTAGANMINDISALKTDRALEVAVELQVPVCLMHMQGKPQDMQAKPDYPSGVVSEINDFFAIQLDRCVKAGLDKNYLILDPGFGFGKNIQHNLSIIKNLRAFKIHSRPILIGVSRKHTLGLLLDKQPKARLIGGISMALMAVQNGAGIIRTHDVDETRQAIRIMEAIHEAQ